MRMKTKKHITVEEYTRRKDALEQWLAEVGDAP